MDEITFKPVSPFQDDVQTMMARLDAHNLALCPPDICHLSTASELDASDCLMLGAFSKKSLCGIGAIKFFDNYGEVTRMFVDERFRHQGIARKLLDLLVEAARKRKLQSVKLETSEKFVNAVALYRSYGFVECAPFGEYVNKPFNRYMQFTLLKSDLQD